MGGPLLREMPRAPPSVKHLPAVPSLFVRTEEILAVGASKWYITGKKTGLADFRKAGPSRMKQMMLLALRGTHQFSTRLLLPLLMNPKIGNRWQMPRHSNSSASPEVISNRTLSEMVLCPLTKLRSSQLRLLSVQPRFGWNCSPTAVEKVSKAV